MYFLRAVAYQTIMGGMAMEEKKCMGDHTHHICELAKEKKFGQIKMLMRAPNYLCANCGRAADKSEHLCNPKHINQIGLM
jgi:hypothetical protein